MKIHTADVEYVIQSPDALYIVAPGRYTAFVRAATKFETRRAAEAYIADVLKRTGLVVEAVIKPHARRCETCGKTTTGPDRGCDC